MYLPVAHFMGLDSCWLVPRLGCAIAWGYQSVRQLRRLVECFLSPINVVASGARRVGFHSCIYKHSAPLELSAWSWFQPAGLTLGKSTLMKIHHEDTESTEKAERTLPA